MNNPGSYFRDLLNNFWVLKHVILLCGSGIWDGKNSDQGSEMEKFGSGMEKIRIRDEKILIQDGKNSDPGSGMEKIRIRDKHPGYAKHWKFRQHLTSTPLSAAG